MTDYDVTPEQASHGRTIPDRDLPMVAAQWLVDGYDSPLLRELASLTSRQALEGERYDEIRAAALGLPDADRANLANDLVHSIDSPYDDRDDTDWDAEIRSRVDDIIEGRVKTIPGDEVRARLAADREERRRRGSTRTEDQT